MDQQIRAHLETLEAAPGDAEAFRALEAAFRSAGRFEELASLLEARARVLPASEAVLMWGSAPVIGVPLVLLFNTIGLNPIVALAGMSLIWSMGDALPPTAIIGRLTVNIVGYDGSYGAFLKACAVPAIIIAVVGTLMVVYSAKLAWLTGL